MVPNGFHARLVFLLPLALFFCGTPAESKPAKELPVPVAATPPTTTSWPSAPIRPRSCTIFRLADTKLAPLGKGQGWPAPYEENGPVWTAEKEKTNTSIFSR